MAVAGRAVAQWGHEVGLRPGRVHEICGPGRRALAAIFAAPLPGPILWIQPDHAPEMICPQGLRGLMDPARLIGVRAARTADALWAAEEALRAKVAGVVVIETATPPALVPVRRLVLAAEVGGGRMTAMLLVPGDGGAAGVESRWHAAPDADGGWRLARRRARMAQPGSFLLRRPDGQAEPARVTG